MGPFLGALLAPADALAEDEDHGEGGGAGVDVDGHAAGEVDGAELIDDPAAGESIQALRGFRRVVFFVVLRAAAVFIAVFLVQAGTALIRMRALYRECAEPVAVGGNV